MFMSRFSILSKIAKLKSFKISTQPSPTKQSHFPFFLVFVYWKTILKMIRPHDDDYKQIKVLGKGAYGEVWLVTNREHQDQQVNSNKKKSIII